MYGDAENDAEEGNFYRPLPLSLTKTDNSLDVRNELILGNLYDKILI